MRQFDRTFRRLSKALAAKEKGENVEGETAIAMVENTGVRGGPIPEEDETSRDAALKNDESNQSWLREQEFMEEGGSAQMSSSWRSFLTVVRERGFR